VLVLNIESNVKISGVLYTLGSVFSASVNFIFIPLFMSKFTVDEYGVYSLIMIVSAISAAIFYLGVTSALTRSFFDYVGQEERDNCFYTSLVLLFFGGGVQILLGFGFSNYISLLLFNDLKWSGAILISLSASSFGFLNFAFLTYFRLINKPYHFLFFSLLTVFSNLTIMYYFVVYENQGVLGALKGAFFSQISTFLVLFFYNGNLIVKSKYLKDEAIIQLRYGFYIVLTSLGGLSILWLDQFFVNKYLDLVSVGIYSLSVKLASVITVAFTTPFVQVFNPMVMEQRKSEKVKELIVKSYEIYILVGMCATVLISFSVEEFIYIFDKKGRYIDSIDYVFPLVLSALIYGLINVVAMGLVFKRKLGRQVVVFTILALVSALLNVYFIPRFGIWGAVTSTFATYFLITIIMGGLSYKIYKVNFPIVFTVLITIIVNVIFVFNLFFIIDAKLEYRLAYKAIVCLSLVFFVYLYFNPIDKIKQLSSKIF
jgi:O-antigen/teichoic acid export membrane protein